MLFNICLLSHSWADLCPESTRSHTATYMRHTATREDFLSQITGQFRAVLSIVIGLVAAETVNRKKFFLFASLPLQKGKKPKRTYKKKNPLPIVFHNYFCCE